MITKIGIILGSVRGDALGSKIFKHLKSIMKDTENVKYTWLDLHDFPLPVYDHEEIPLMAKVSGTTDMEDKWLNAVEEQDGYIMMTPEYNHAIPGGFKNALDLVGSQVSKKPVQIISYSCFSDGGMLAATSMVPILQIMDMIVMPKPVLVWNAESNFEADGTLNKDVENSEHFEKRFGESFHDIEFYAKVLKENPYK
ncbi:flavoprotein [Companilactobacillus tucceti DSM 20183]|uniref:Flavoprotein n=1 Tax=Companilactobacillus tucceti DSM 20183 TaxID=1423811 RepID=A0A0R1IZQ7_9LACO|nr:NAD(P)H-dependent oxidoreductase [Companilactobacillus tucceti]KRK64662.1 flavoprotein [Companilactobacillus tucceti DSM 20183]